MTDQTIPAVTNHGRRLAHSWAETVKANPECWGQRQLAAAHVILNDLPAPPPPTLADMLPKERAACQWMQADVDDHNTRYVIVNPDDGDGEAELIAADGRIEWIFPECVIPRPDLPRMEWPGNKKPDPAPNLPDGWRFADHKVHGRVIVANPTPSSDGRVYYVLPSSECMGFDWLFCDHSELTYIPQ